MSIPNATGTMTATIVAAESGVGKDAPSPPPDQVESLTLCPPLIWLSWMAASTVPFSAKVIRPPASEKVFTRIRSARRFSPVTGLPAS